MHPLPVLFSQRSWSSHLWEIHTKGIHVQPIQERREVLAEPRQALMHKLQVHHIGLEIGHRVRKLGKLWL